jgi:hypothetical protein
VFDTRVEDLLGGLEMAQVTHLEGVPEESTDASRTVSPCHPRAVGEFIGHVFVGAGAIDLFLHLAKALAQTAI